MTEVTTSHHTIVVRRSYDAPVALTYRAWSDPEQLKQWYTPGDRTWTVRIEKHDFHVGGVKRIIFGPPAETFVEDCRYEDIVPERRLCYAMTIARGDNRITTSMVTVEFGSRGRSTDVKVTDQLVILDGGETVGDRERGWGETLDKLPPVLRAIAGW
jgi:uncharacterized protein YndB with AHSA1/START domain